MCSNVIEGVGVCDLLGANVTCQPVHQEPQPLRHEGVAHLETAQEFFEGKQQLRRGLTEDPF
ncbi:MAG: hypothetical protein MJZ77_03855 [Bacteroidales bacterium]|nr:hypothetical protein [Bacteroidales bacterium]